MPSFPSRRSLAAVSLAAVVGLTAVTVGGWSVGQLGAATGRAAGGAVNATGAPVIEGPTGGPNAGSGQRRAGGAAVGVPAQLYRAPTLSVPLHNLDPGLAVRGPRPTLRDLMAYQYSNPYVFTMPDAAPSDWQLARPDPLAVQGYADQISVLPGGDLTLHLSGRDPTASVDVFRMGLGDGRRVTGIARVRIAQQVSVGPRLADGLVEETWPASAVLHIGPDWRSGVYLAKLTGSSGGQSYVPFIVRETSPQPLTVVVPTLTWQAYNDFGGSDLYGWVDGPRERAFAVSFDRPFLREDGAALFFRLDFPLIVWLEDHGYTPGYVADLDLHRYPTLATGAKTLVFSGHGEYWTRAMRDHVEAAAAGGTNLAFMAANQAFWQVRLEPSASGAWGRIVVGYKSAVLDPLAAVDPTEATVRFEDPPVNRPPSTLMGLEYGGVVEGIRPMILADGIDTFAPDLGFRPGQQLPGLIADEVDTAPVDFDGLLLGATPVTVTRRTGTVTATAGLWIAPTGSRVFDAGTFDFSWGLDPRYAGALPQFPASPYSHLMARILAWLGAEPKG